MSGPAHAAVRAALKRGDLIRPNICSDCGATSPSLHGHHADYSKPLEVEWLCASCHVTRHVGQSARPDTDGKVQVFVRMPASLHARVKSIAKEEGRSMTSVITEAIEEWVSK